ncbi:MAG TPA: 30S ribosomal protein S12 methylthiotransferase RimO [Longilinea sp.]|nr:30S ribosomal protein S12 methylthiotransferase RimO [Longilinea sp.]
MSPKNSSQKSFYLVSLGCAKNTVDSESMAGLLTQAGFEAMESPKRATYLIVNTCGFIQAARKESIEVLQDLSKKKKPGQYLIAAGCLTERYRAQIAEEVPGLDGVMGTRRWMDILDLINDLRPNPPAPLYHLPDVPSIGLDEHGIIRAALQGGSAYLKIADGCRRPCAFCAIPLIKGTTVSRPMETILSEAEALQDLGVQELVLLAQDTTDYGFDLGLEDGLSQLLEKMLPRIPDIPWVRILYAFPGYISDRLIELMAAQNQLLPYLDIPLQHANPHILRNMRRPSDMDGVFKTIEKIRKAIPNVALRSTFIVGFPGETEQQFQTLLDFLTEIQFDRVGAFTYSFETGTGAEPLGDPITQEEKESRLERLMLLQQQISLQKNQALVGKTLDIIIEGVDNDLSIGRSYRDAPEIDGLVIVEGQADIGSIVPVVINGAMPYDLTGQFVKT